jgi:hypothetical protein
MDALVQAALLGTARAPATDTHSPAGALVAGLPEIDPERALLLRGGADAIYRQAGNRLPALMTTLEPAPPERLPACSLTATRLFRDMLEGPYRAVLPEALDRLKRAGLRLPAPLLPKALEHAVGDVRAGLLPVIGERGRWLSQFNPAWHWAADAFIDATGIPANAETRWREGRDAERLSILRRFRTHDPAHARTLLDSVWRQEKADFRTETIQTLAENLSIDDESFLEAALDDRAQDVRQHAAQLLAHLRDSAFVRRITDRTNTILRGIDAACNLEIAVPESFDMAWQRDGIQPKPPPYLGVRAWWLEQLLALVPPSHWARRFAGTPDTLVETAARDTAWGFTTIKGWARAAALHRDIAWATPLANWMALDPAGTESKPAELALCADLIAIMPEEAAGQLISMLLSSPPGAMVDRWYTLINLLPGQWSEAVSLAYLRATRKYFGAKEEVGESWADRHVIANWLYTLVERAAIRIPPSCFAEALIPLPLPGGTSAYTRQWEQSIQTFTETIRFRQRLMKEIPL